MNVTINSRGNGACPICEFNGKCTIQNKIAQSIQNTGKKEELEIVIYSCPKFREKA